MKKVIMCFLVALILIFASIGVSYAAKGFFLCKMQGGSPMLGNKTYHGYVFIGNKGQWGAYIISGTGQQLTDIDGLATCIGISTKTMLNDTVRTKLNDTVRTKINTWLENNDYTERIPANATNRQVIRGLYKLIQPICNDENCADVAGLPEDEVHP